jgi:hypothetical protein
VVAGLSLYWRRLPLPRRRAESGPFLAGPVRAFQSGVINDYVTWIVVGIAGVGGILALTLR